MVTLAHSPTRSSLKIKNRSFRNAALHLVYEMNSPLIFESFVSLLHFHLSHMVVYHHLLHHLHYHHLHLLLLAQ